LKEKKDDSQKGGIIIGIILLDYNNEESEWIGL
jgi:hypothetical protein